MPLRSLLPSLPTSLFIVGCNQHSYKHHYNQDHWHSPRLMRLVADEGDNHAVEVEEEHEQMEAQLDEGFLSAC